MGTMTLLITMPAAMATTMAAAMGAWGPGNGPGNGPDGDFWWVGRLLFFVLWIAVIALVVRWVARRGGRQDQVNPLDRARGILAERFAQGEIDADEYRLRSEQLR